MCICQCNPSHSEVWLFFIRAKPKWIYWSRDGRPHANVAGRESLKEEFKHHFHSMGNTREGKMVCWRNIKWNGNETLDEFSNRVTQISNH